MPDQPNNRTVFFRHLPKTAGTSLTTTLANIYGEGQTYRFRHVGEGFGDLFGSTLQARGDVLSLVSGHIPMLAVAEGACGPEFTILREPIARLLSLRRFLEIQPAEDRRRMGLGDRITVADMLASRAPEVYGQVRNGMARFFSHSHAFADPEQPSFWHPNPSEAIIEDCAQVLTRQAVGTVEDMPTAMRLLQRRLQVPYALEIGMENFTTERRDEVSLEELRALIEVNAVDLALYHTVMKRLPRSQAPVALGDGFDRRTLFDPRPDVTYTPMQIPGRQGFELYEASDKLSWIGDSGRARIHLAPSAVPVTLKIALYGIVKHYPMAEMRILLDGARWPAQPITAPSHMQFVLAPIPAHAGPVELTLVQPYSAPVAAITAGSPDRRRLGAALLNIRCEPA